MERKVKFEASVKYCDDIKLVITGTAETLEDTKLKELVETIKESVLDDFNQGSKKFEKNDIKVKIIKDEAKIKMIKNK